MDRDIRAAMLGDHEAAKRLTEQGVLQTGKEFFAKDKLGDKYRYKFIGIDISSNASCRYILLNNIDTNTETRVEIEWFRHRMITED